MNIESNSNTEEQADTNISSNDVFFTPELKKQSGVLYEQGQTRSGIVPVSSIDLLDEPELVKYMRSLQSECGMPEAKEIEDIQNRHMSFNARNGKEQIRLTNREVFKTINIGQSTSGNSSANTFLDKLPLIKQVRSTIRVILNKKALLRAEKDYIETDLMLAKDWRQVEHDLPAVDVRQSKLERDLYYNFDTMFRQLVLNLADYIGKLPASESHHHNWPGGLLKHSLEVASVALKYARHWDLTPIGLNDYEAQRKPRWKYAAWVIGLLHDVGKAITDMIVVCEDANGQTFRWNPMLASLNEFCVEKKIIRYYIDMNDASKYLNGVGRFKRHEGMGGALLEKLLTPECRHYLTSSPDPGFGLYEQVSSILSGKKGDEYLMKALEEGEKLSVHLSYKKIRSDFHLNNRNASISELMMRELPYMTEQPNFMKNVFVVSGYVMLRYPEALNQLKQAVINKSPDTKAILNYSAMELGKQLSSANFIRKVSNDNFLPRFAPTKQVLKRDKKSKEDVISYERDSGFCAVVVLEHATLLFGNKDLPASSTGVLSLTMDKSLEFIGDNEVIEHKNDRSSETAPEPGISEILDPEAKFNIVQKINTVISDDDPDSMAGEKASEVKQCASSDSQSRSNVNSNTATSGSQGVSGSEMSNSPHQQVNRAPVVSQRPSEGVPPRDNGNRQANQRKQAKKAAQSQSKSRAPSNHGKVDVFALDQPTAVIPKDKVYDAPDSLMAGVDQTTSEDINLDNRQNVSASSVSQSGLEQEHSDDNGPTIASMPDNYEQVPLDSYQDMPTHDMAEPDDNNYDDIYSLPNIDTSHNLESEGNSEPVSNIAVEPFVDSQPPAEEPDIHTKLFGEWIQISKVNREVFEKRTLQIMLFKAPFFTDNAKRAGRDDWAMNGGHVERRNSRVLKLKQSFVDKVLDHVDGPVSTTEGETIDGAQTENASSQSNTSTHLPNIDTDIANSGNQTDASEGKMSMTEVRKRAKANMKAKTVEHKDSHSNSTSPTPNPRANDTEDDHPRSSILERIRNQVLGNLTIEAKFRSGRIPKPMFNATIKNLGYTHEDLKSVGLLDKVDARNAFINVDVLLGNDLVEDKKDKSRSQGESLISNTAGAGALQEMGDEPEVIPNSNEPIQSVIDVDQCTGTNATPVHGVNSVQTESATAPIHGVNTSQEVNAHQQAEPESSITTSESKVPVHGVNSEAGEHRQPTPASSEGENTLNKDTSSIDTVDKNLDHSNQSIEDQVQAALIKALSNPALKEQLSNSGLEDENRQFIAIDVHANMEWIQKETPAVKSITIMTFNALRSGEVFTAPSNKLNRDGTTEILLSDFLVQCIRYIETKKSTMKVVQSTSDEVLQNIPTSMWSQFAGNSNIATVGYEIK